MANRGNYKFERLERERAKAAKAAEKAAAKRRDVEPTGPEHPGQEPDKPGS